MVGNEFGCSRRQVVEVLGLDMPSLMLPSFPDLPYCSSGWAGPGEVVEVLEAHLAPTSSWHIPPAQGTQPGVRISPHPTPRHTERQRTSRAAGVSLPAVQDHSAHALRESRATPALLQQRQPGSCPFLGHKKQIPQVNAKPSGCLIIFWSSSRDAWG